MDGRAERQTGARPRAAGPEFQCNDPLATVDEDLRIARWNEAAERLTGTRAEDALGAYCFDVLRASDELGEPICRPGCELARRAFAGEPAPSRHAILDLPGGPHHVTLVTLGADVAGGSYLLHLLVEPPARPRRRSRRGAAAGPPHLTGRQHEVLRLLAEGVSVRSIAGRLGIAETTARNHIRAILAALECHSQLEAVAKARRLGLV